MKTDKPTCTCIPVTKWTVSPESMKRCPRHARVTRRKGRGGMIAAIYARKSQDDSERNETIAKLLR